MTPRERLIFVSEQATPEEAKALLQKHRLERVLVVNDAFELRGLITVTDILKSTEHPQASKDEQGKLRVAAAIGVGEGTEERAEALAETTRIAAIRRICNCKHADIEAQAIKDGLARLAEASILERYA